MEQTCPIIATNYKAKIPQTHSWPVASKELSEALQHCPQFEHLSVTFRGVYNPKQIYRAGRLAWPAKEQILLDACHATSQITEQSFDDSRESVAFIHPCTLSIHPVLRKHRKQLHDNVMNRLPLLATWLAEQNARRVLERTSFMIVWEYEPNQVVTRVHNSVETERI